jgi:hypothetical protein
MKKTSLKNAAVWLLASLTVIGAAHAADPGPKLGNKPPMTPPVLNLPMGGLQMASVCPAPYNKDTGGFDVKKGEFECIKTAATCPDGYDSQRNDVTGQLTCTPKQIPGAPQGWVLQQALSTTGKYVYDSYPQPMINCPKSTPDWQWGTTYWKEGWNRMGCRANLKPAY